MRNNIILYVRALAIVSLCLLMGSCNTLDEDDRPDNGGFSFYFKLPQAISVETKAEGSGDVHVGDNDQINITDAWIVQYVEGNTSLTIIKHYTQEQIVSVNDYQVRITADSKDFSVEDSHFYIILNGGNTLFGEGETPAEDALKQKTVDFKTTDIQNLPNILTCGPVAYKKVSAAADPSVGGDTEEKKVEFVTKVYNPCAKVSVWVKLNDANIEKLEVTDLSVTNIPSKIFLFDTKEKPTGYLEKQTIFTGSQNYTTTTDVDPLKVFYMPENLQGKGAGTSGSDKNKPDNGPNGSLTNCTYLTVKGNYYYKGLTQAAMGVEYCFYLGDNNNYNIQRNKHYKLTLNLAGANSVDWRVKIIDGNVAIFDDVDESENETEF